MDNFKLMKICEKPTYFIHTTTEEEGKRERERENNGDDDDKKKKPSLFLFRPTFLLKKQKNH